MIGIWPWPLTMLVLEMSTRRLEDLEIKLAETQLQYSVGGSEADRGKMESLQWMIDKIKAADPGIYDDLPPWCR